MSGRVEASLGGGMLLLSGLCGLSWNGPGVVSVSEGKADWEISRWGAYAFEGGFGGQAGFGIVLAADGCCE